MKFKYILLILNISLGISNLSCNLCKNFFGVINKAIDSKLNKDVIIDSLQEFCNGFPKELVKLSGEKSECSNYNNCKILCKGMVRVYVPNILKAINLGKMNNTNICINLKSCKGSVPYIKNLQNL